MANDVQIAGGVGPAPQSYTVPNATEIIPRVINATFDGTLAGSSFLPTLEIVSDGGVVVARCPTASAVASGGKAEVSFFPNGDKGGGTAGIEEITSTGGTVGITNPFGPVTNLESFGGYSPPTAREYITAVTGVVAGSSSGGFSFSHSSGSALVNYTDPVNPKIVTAGIYAFTGQASVAEAITAGYELSFSFAVLTGDVPLSAGQVVGGVVDSYKYVPLAIVVYCAANTVFGGGMTNFDTINHNGAINQFVIQRIT